MKNTINLSGKWLYCIDPEEKGEQLGYQNPENATDNWGTMDIPVNWYLTELKDYSGTVWFRTAFDAPADTAEKDIWLKFYAVDYYADVWLNGKHLGWHEGYFTPFEFNITGKLLDKGNVLVVKNNSPTDPTVYLPNFGPEGKSNPLSHEYRGHWAKDLTLVKGHHLDAMHRPGSMTKFRGEGNSGGIWQKVELSVTEKVRIVKTKVYSMIVREEGVLDGSAIVSIDLTIDNSGKTPVDTEVSLDITPANFAGSEKYSHQKSVRLQPGRNEVKLIKTIEKPRLWYTWDFGKPDLYNAKIDLEECETKDVRFGIKEVTHDPITGHWTLNGDKVFWRGMRYLSSLWISEMNEERYRKDLNMMLDLNINSIRIGSHVELDEFYSLCDEMGFMVWQVFPLHYCYSDCDDLIERCVPMMKEMVEMLHNHASIGAWSVFKEPKVYALPNMPNNYGRLCQLMIEAAKTVDPIRWMHSGDYEEGVMNITVGQCYPWDWDIKKHELTPIIVEFGCGTFVSKESMLKVLPESELWPPNWDQWEYYNCFYNITFNVAGLKLGNSLEEFIDNAQEYQARCIKEQIEYCRQIKYGPVGSMYLYYWSEPWPNIGASGLVDYFRTPFKSYESFKQVYTPVLVSFEWDKEPYILGKQKHYKQGQSVKGNLWLTNDHLTCIQEATLTWAVRAEGSDDDLTGDSLVVCMEKDSAKVAGQVDWVIPTDLCDGVYVLQMTVTAKDGSILSNNDFQFEVAG